MLLAFDTYYYNDKAKTVCLAFESWTNEHPTTTYTEELTGVEEYTPGAFYKRELPCILSLLKRIPLDNIEAIIIDGFVILDDAGTPGLGGHLYNTVAQNIPIIGVAKTNFATLQNNKRALLRGNSNRPLYITSIGLDLDEATENVRTMHGEFRIPTLLKQLDNLTKQTP
jgi:exodeoxyribonuclease-5/deoxyribonuclease V